MIFKFKKHKKINTSLYNILLLLSRNIFFYKEIGLKDTFETRLYLMFFHFSILMLIFKIKGLKFDQDNYDFFFHNIENDIRELGYGDVTVNKKMKEFNKVLYDILLKLEDKKSTNDSFKLNIKILYKYFNTNNKKNDLIYEKLDEYFVKFFTFCFELPIDNMLNNLDKFKFNYGCT